MTFFCLLQMSVMVSENSDVLGEDGNESHGMAGKVKGPNKIRSIYLTS